MVEHINEVYFLTDDDTTAKVINYEEYTLKGCLNKIISAERNNKIDENYLELREITIVGYSKLGAKELNYGKFIDGLTTNEIQLFIKWRNSINGYVRMYSTWLKTVRLTNIKGKSIDEARDVAYICKCGLYIKKDTEIYTVQEN